jgi:RNA polymerase sigma factor (sigma-70 family)
MNVEKAGEPMQTEPRRKLFEKDPTLARRYDRLVRETSPMLHGVTRSMTDNPSDVEDIVQKVYTKVAILMDSGRFHPDRLPNGFNTEVSDYSEAYLVRSARNAVRDHYRQRASRREVLVSTISPEDQMRFDTSVPIDETITTQMVVRDGLRHVSPVHQEALVYYYIGDFTTQEIAERQRVPRGSVKSRLFYGKKELKKQLEPKRKRVR